MGNKRKASIIIASVIIAAFTLCFATYDVITRLGNSSGPTANAADSITSSSAKFNYGTNYGGSVSTTGVSGATYMIIFGGGSGVNSGGGYAGGYGATCIGFYKASSTAWTNYYGQGYGKGAMLSGGNSAAGYNNGGGYTKVSVNFARPTGYTGETTAIAAGGGGGGYNAAANQNARFIGADRTAVTGTFYFSTPSDDTYYSMGVGSIPGGSARNGNTGYQGSTTNASSAAYYTGVTVPKNRGALYLGGGGGGYYAGGGARVEKSTFKIGHFTGSGTDTITVGNLNGYSGSSDDYSAYGFGGGGGACSPSCYPVKTYDSRQSGVADPSTGCFAYYYRIDTNNYPTSVTTTYGTTATLKAASATSYYTPVTAVKDVWSGQTSGFGWKTAWVYSTDSGSTWTTTLPTRSGTSLGTTSVTCKYVLYNDDGYSSTIGPSYKVGCTSADAAAASTEYTIYTCTRSLTVTTTGEASVTKDPSAKNPVYTGSAVQLINAGTASNGTMYYAKTATSVQSAPTSASDWTSSATSITDTNYGTYRVWYYAKGTQNSTVYYTDSAKSYTDVNITKQPATVKTAPGVTARTYNGSAQQIITSAGVANTGGSMQYSLDGSTWYSNYADSNLYREDAGTYTVYYKAVASDGNYSDGSVSSTTVKISKRSLTVSTAPTIPTSRTYNGTAQALISAAGAASTGGTMRYSLDNTNWYTDITNANLKKTNADKYTVYYYAYSTDTANNENSKSVSVEVTINKRQLSVTTAPTVASGLVYNTAAQQLITVAGSASTGGTMQYQVDGTSGTWYSDITNAALKKTNAGTYTVYYQAYSSDTANNTSSTAASFTVTIDKLQISNFTAPTGISGLTYTGAAQGLLNSAGSATGGTMYFQVDSTSDTGWLDNINNVKATTNGDHKVYYYAEPANANYSASTKDRYITVNIASIPASWATEPSVPTVLVYNAEAQYLFTSKGEVATNAAGTAVGTASYRVASYTDMDGAVTTYNETTKPWKSSITDTTLMGTASGTYELQYRIVGATGYTTIVNSVTVSIGKNAVSWPANTATPTPKNDLVYNGSDQQLLSTAPSSVSVNGSSLTVQYRLGSGDWQNATDALDNFKGNAAGTYTIFYRIKGDNSNADSPTMVMSVQIAKAIAEVNVNDLPQPSDASYLIYDGSEKTLLKSGGSVSTFTSGVAMGTMKYELNGVAVDSWSACTAINAGTYTIAYYAYSSNPNYSSSSKSYLTVTISKRSAEITAVPVPQNNTYTGAAQYLIKTAGSAYHGIMKYGLKDEETGVITWYTNYHDAALTKKNVGTYTIYYKAEAVDVNYADSETYNITSIMDKEAPTLLAAPRAQTSLEYIADTNQQLLASGGSVNNGVIWFRLVGSDDYNNDLWTWNNETDTSWQSIVGCEIGEYVIEYYIKGDEPNFSDGAINKLYVSISLAHAKVTTAPEATPDDDLKFNEGNPIQLLVSGGVAEFGSMRYKLDNGEWVEDFTLLTGSAVGTYTIYYKAVATDTTKYVDSVEYSFQVSIGTSTSIISSSKELGSTLAFIEDLKYTGAALQLFQGVPYKSSDGTVYYTVVANTTGVDETTTPDSSVEGSADLGSITGVDAYSGNKQITYYLYFRVAKTASYDAIDWTYSGISNQIGRASYAVSVNKNTDATYDGLVHQIFAGTPTITSTAKTEWVTVNYSLRFNGYNGAEVYYPATDETTTDALVLNNTPIDAGMYYLQATWVVDAEHANQIVSQEEKYTLAIFTIKKATSATGVSVNGLSPISLVTIGSDGAAYPFLGDQQVDLRFGSGVYNDITTDNYAGYNKLGIVFTKSTSTPSDEDFASSSYDLANDLNNAIRNLSANESGVWHLWFNIAQHNNLESNVRFEVATITVNGFNSAEVPLGGVIMRGVTATAANGVAVYNGTGYSVVADNTGALAVKDNSNLHIGNVGYAVSSSSSVVPEDDQWVYSIDSLKEITRVEVGTYYLWVKWTAGLNVTESTGRVYANFQIVKLSTGNGSFYFQGVNFNNEESATVDNNVKTYSYTFNNDNQELVSAQPTILAYEEQDANTDLAKQFGTFNLGVSFSDVAMTGSGYVSLSEYQKLSVRDVGTYYLWVSWSGSENFEAGAALYRVREDDDIVTPKFQVNQLTTDEIVELENTSFIKDTSDDHEHKYQFISTGNTFQGVAQGLFTMSSSPSVNINGYAYDATITYQYLLADSNNLDVVKAISSGWVSSAEAAKQTDVGTYYLWIKITINNTNVNIVKYQSLASSDIVATSSFVHTAPTAVTGLTYDGKSHVLISADLEQVPGLEYSLDGNTWNTDVSKIVATEAGIYNVYYRGAAYAPMFNTETKPVTGYPIVKITIGMSRIDIKVAPKAVSGGVTYTGKAFNIADLVPNIADAKAEISAEGGENVVLPLLYKWDDSEEWYSYSELPQKTNAGTYVLSYKYDNTGHNSIVEDTNIAYIMIYINKVGIEIGNTTTGNRTNLIYKAAGYPVFLSAVDYGMYDNNDFLSVDGVALTYENYGSTSTYGAMGTIYYAVSTDANVEPAPGDWVTNYQNVTVRQVGTYYAWVKVDAGDNHLGHSAQCFSNSRIVIVAADNESVKLDDTTYTVQLGNDDQVLRYNGLTRTLIADLARDIKVLNRDSNGAPIKDENGNYTYNSMYATDRVGTIYYALMNTQEAPGENDFTSTGWQDDWRTLAKTNAGTYYLYIRFLSDSTSNIGSFNVLLTDGTRPEITIAKANKNDLNLSGISGISQMYTGDEQSIAVGDLTVTIKSSRYNVTSEIDLDEVRYYFWKRPTSGAAPTNYDWATWANATALDVGQYQLYVYIRALNNSDNIDTDTTALIYPLFVNATTGLEDNFAEITPADEHYINVLSPSLVTGLSYNGQERRLIASAATLEMQNGNALNGFKGTAWYYISGSSTSLTKVGTYVSGVQSTDDGWYDDPLATDTLLKQVYAGTYYIWVKFDAGDSHTAVAPRYIGEVTIAQADGNGITLSGMELLKNNQYDGKYHNLVDESLFVEQTFNGTDTTLVQGIDYLEIYYGYSNDSHIEPTDWIAENDLNTLTAREAGNYYIWVKVIGMKNPRTGTVNVADYSRCYDDEDYASIAPLTLIKDYYKAGITTHTGLSYIGEYQVLAHLNLNAEDKLPIIYGGLDLNTAVYNENIVVSWGLGATAERYGAPIQWFTDLSDLQGLNAGNYYLWIKITGSDNINEYVECFATIQIDKATIVYTTAPRYFGDDTYESLIYTGDDQTLLISDPVAMFQPSGIYYASGAQYNAVGVVVQYSIGSENLGIYDYQNIKGLDAGTYEVCYGVFESSNWYHSIDRVNVKIKARDASEMYYGLEMAPAALDSVEYNEEEQNVISFGRLASLTSGRGAALEGSKIEFWYDNETARYVYYYNKTTGEYVWERNVKLPGQVDAGSYTIHYMVTASDTGNYADSAVYTINATISPRRIWWVTNPDAIHGLRYNGSDQAAIYEGQLNVPVNASGVKVMYTTKAPGDANRWKDWGVNVPLVNDVGVWDIYYYVELDSNNVFVGPEDNTEAMGTLIKVMVENFVLTIRSAPTSDYLRYTAVAQDLISYASLSTDNNDTFAAADLPYFQYRFEGESEWYDNNIQATDRGEYTIYYRLRYNHNGRNIFEFSGDIPAEGKLTATIQAMYFDYNSISAVYNADDNTLDIDASAYTTELQNEIKVMENGKYKYIHFQYRKYDDYNQSTVWQEWTNGETALSLGSYQFRVVIQDDGNNGESNFYAYTQEGDFATTEVAEDRILYVEMPKNTYSTVAYVRAWIDFTGTMLYEDAPEQFKYEGWVNTSNPLFYIFPNVNSAGRNGSAVIRVQTVNSAYYFRSTDDNYTSADYRKEQKVINWSDDEDYVNRGLVQVETTIRLYEVYHIQYDANGAVLMQDGVAPTDGWKWHGINYLLEENVYHKYTDDNKELSTNGWNTTRAGNGNNYANGSYYRENVSQIFYANFFTSDENATVRIEWIITNGITTYRLATNTGGWYNVSGNEERDHGIFVTKGTQITLPQIIEDEDGNKFWEGTLFGNYYISGWYMANDDWTLADGTVGTNWYQGEYALNMSATRDLTFVAKLASQAKGKVECVFKDNQDNQVNYSGLIANGANAYMALSGMDANTINNYSDGYKDWVEKYGDTTLVAPSTGKIEYELGAKTVVDTQPDEDAENSTNNEYMIMFIILGVGVITTAASLSVYLVMRKKNRPVNLKKFKEEVKGRNRV